MCVYCIYQNVVTRRCRGCTHSGKSACMKVQQEVWEKGHLQHIQVHCNTNVTVPAMCGITLAAEKANMVRKCAHRQERHLNQGT
jgi:hypothetical protein